MIKKSLVKKYINSKGFRIKPEALSILERAVVELIDKSCDSAKRLYKRKTIYPIDIESISIKLKY